MALDVNGREQDDNSDPETPKGKSDRDMSTRSEETEDEEEEEDEEPRLKYASLTKSQGSVYRNGDATSAFLVAGDKMVVGTHNGNIHILALPSFQFLRVYHAHSATITAVSISPFPPPLPTAKPEALNRLATEQRSSPRTPQSQNTGSPSSKSPQQAPVPNTPSNSIYVATSSIDGNVCVSSLIDPKDVILRNFGRPVQAVALSPDYKNDRAYLSGGLAGNFVLTVGGRAGTSSTSSTTGTASAITSSWLGTIGLQSNNGTDTVLHSGEGSIGAIKWSLTGRFVVWVNEHGIKIVRSNLHLETAESQSAWKGISHIDRPNLPGWEEMAGLWKARAEWINEEGLESDVDYMDVKEPDSSNKTETASIMSADVMSLRSFQTNFQTKPKPKPVEKLIVGWGGNIWIINVHPGGPTGGREGSYKKWRVELVTNLRTDCIISGVSLYTPSLLIVLAYIPPTETESSEAQQGTRKKGVHRRQNALQPEMRIIDIATKEEVCTADTLNFSRFESLSATDYHLGVLPVYRSTSKVITHRGAMEVITDIGGGIWDATLYPTRLFNSAASVKSSGSSGDPFSGGKTGSMATTGPSTAPKAQAPHPSILIKGMKIFIQSPYDLVLATKPTISDHLAWLDTHEKYEDAWKLLNTHPEAASGKLETAVDSTPSTPTKVQGSLVDFFADDSSQDKESSRNFNSQAEKEKRRIGELWLQQLVKNKEWARAGEVAGQVLGNSSRWEHWVWVFAEANKYKEITPYIPITQLQPPLPSLVYEVILGHYISQDRLRLRDVMERWPPELYDVSSIITAIEGKLRMGDIRPNTTEGGEPGRDWRILTQSLAKLYLADGRAKDALKCYIQLQDADTALGLIKDYHIVDALSDDIPGLILLRISPSQQKCAPLPELEEMSLEPISLLVEEAHNGTVPPSTVISQLEHRSDMLPYLYFYFRALWCGSTSPSSSSSDFPPSSPLLQKSHNETLNLTATEGRNLVNDHADLALALFSTYNRALLFQFLQSSQSYTLETATSLCEQKSYIPELVHLYSKQGRPKRALQLLTTHHPTEPALAIAFAKQQGDEDLWADLLAYSMERPMFIRALLEEVGTAVDPIALIRRIPEGLEIEGLKDALGRMIREYELQDSISEGVARVLRGEVAAAMATLRTGQKKGVKFEVHTEQKTKPDGEKKIQVGTKPGHCPKCTLPFEVGDMGSLIGFPCAHVYHVSCLYPEYTDEERVDEERNNWDWSVGAKIDHAVRLRKVVGLGCPVERDKSVEEW